MSGGERGNQGVFNQKNNCSRTRLGRAVASGDLESENEALRRENKHLKEELVETREKVAMLETKVFR